MNPRYSMRAFAQFLGLQSSKLSEILNYKKGISEERAEKLATKLNFSAEDREVFLLSVKAQHSRIQKERLAAQERLAQLKELSHRKKSSRRNAWYFGAVDVLNKVGIEDEDQQAQLLSIKELQAESANRYLKRILKLHPEVNEIEFEPESLMKKLNESFVESESAVQQEARFLFLSDEELIELQKEFSLLIEKFKKTSNHEGQKLKMVLLNSVNLIKGEK